MQSAPVLRSLSAVVCLLVAGCNYDVPLTKAPTRPVDERLLGDWVGGDDGREHMNVRRFDDFNYVISYEGELYRAFHSDFAGIHFLSVQDLNAKERKYLYMICRLSEDGARLGLQGLDVRIVPETTKGRDAIQELIKTNRQNPDLFGEILPFTRAKPRRPD